MGGGWHHEGLEVAYQVLGWTAFVSWSISFYPQVILNYRRKSVVGLNFDFLVLNLTKHTSYLIFNAALYFSPVVQKQYHQNHSGKIPVAANDVAFSVHAVLLTAITLIQVLKYERGNQRVSLPCIAITVSAWLSAAICVFVGIHCHAWLWIINVFSMIQVIMTVIKYIPQAVMNFQRKSTVGWSIGNILLDLTGGLTNYGQMAMQSIDQGSWDNISGNKGKFALSLISVFFDLLFMFQHYVLYRPKNKNDVNKVDVEPAITKYSENSQLDNV